MGKSDQGSHRTTISIPADLKRRMDAVTESVNWSAIAAKAFEQKLVEIATQRKGKSMEDLIQRFRAAAVQAEDAAYQAGDRDGREWCAAHTPIRELKHLERYRDHLGEEGWDIMFTEGHNSGHSGAETMYFAMVPEDAGNRRGAQEFWETALGGNTDIAGDPSYVKGFVEGALALWEEVKDQL